MRLYSKKKRFALWLSLLLLFSACRKKEPPVPEAPALPVTHVQVKLGYHVDQAALRFSEQSYVTPAGFPFSVTLLSFYLSRVKLITDGGTEVSLTDYHFFDAATPALNVMDTYGLPAGTYTAVSFTFGLDSLLNRSFSLPHTEDNLNMQWPDPMGGGYHFLKMEGYYKSGNDQPGFAVHIGSNGFTTTHRLPVKRTVAPGTTAVIDISMNVNEWLRTPRTFDFNVQGNYTMGVDSLMKMITENGKDAFTITD
jgi:hypothetical protein